MEFPLVQALFGRRSRRFGLGMEVPSGPLAFSSGSDPIPLNDLELSLLVAAATGVSGWSFGVPFGPRTPESHAEFTLRLTGRTAPTAAGLGTPALFYTDDTGCYVVRTRDLQPQALHELAAGEDALQRILNVARGATTRLREGRLDLPSAPPHILPPNLWWANRPGSTLFMPVADASEECLGFLALMIRHGVTVVDHDTGLPAGDLERFVRSGLLDPEKQLPISELLSDVQESLCLELAFMGHNIVLMLQAIGLGGLYFNGMDGLSVLGANAADGVVGLGFRFVEDERWITPNPVGLAGIYEALCPPNYPDMRAAVEAFVDRKFGPGGSYDPDTPGPWLDSPAVKRTVAPYQPEFVDCMTEVAQYLYDKYGKFPGTRSTIMLPGFVQAHHLDTDFYDTHYQPGAYLETHAHHMERWHS
ncbi:MAG TPA: hypothetical protein VJR05_11370 [Acidimicrobiia bacterium]|nr:hypothetical protein [Acidimicrobiia bacterium]